MISTTTRRLATAIASTGLLFALANTTAQAGTMPTNQHDYIYREMGQTTPEARSVGAITVGWEEGGDVVRGSGVLVGGRYVLTAAHLVDEAIGGNFNLNGQNYNMVSWVVANQFYSRDTDGVPNPENRVFGNGADLALVLLDRPVVGARNLRATISKSRQEAGKTATIVGYGQGGSGALGTNSQNGALLIPGIEDGAQDDMGAGTSIWSYQPVIRAGKNKVEMNGPFGTFTKSNRELVTDFDPDPSQLSSLADAGLNPPQFDSFSGEWNIDEDDIPVTGEYMPAFGDSGGGLFINGKLAGITSWTTRANSEFFSQASYSRLSVGWWKWVRDNIKAYNHVLRNGLTARPWNRVDNGGNGFRGVAKILSESQLETDSGQVIYWEGQVIDIFGPHLFHDENGDYFNVGTNVDFLVNNDLFADPAPLPEPTSLALLTLGGIAMLRRTRA